MAGGSNDISYAQDKNVRKIREYKAKNGKTLTYLGDDFNYILSELDNRSGLNTESDAKRACENNH